MDNSRDCRAGNRIGSCKRCDSRAGSKLGADGAYLFCRQFGVSRPASFSNRVHDVVLCSSSKHMGGVATRMVVTGMASIQVRGKRSIDQLVGKTMRLDRGRSGIETTISAGSNACFPGPAFTGATNVYFRPEAFNEIPLRSISISCVSTVLATEPAFLRRRAVIFYPADLTGKSRHHSPLQKATPSALAVLV